MISMSDCKNKSSLCAHNAIYIIIIAILYIEVLAALAFLSLSHLIALAQPRCLLGINNNKYTYTCI